MPYGVLSGVLPGVVGGSAVLSALPQVASLVASWSADDIAPQADNTSLATWTDSKNAVALTTATGMSAPKYRTNAVGMHPAVEFDGSTTGLMANRGPVTSALDTREYTVICVVTGIATTQFGALLGTVSSNSDGLWLVANASSLASFAFQDGALATDAFAYPYTSTGFTTLGFTSSLNSHGAGANNGLSRMYIQGMCAGIGLRDAEKGPTSGGGTNKLGVGALVNGSNASEMNKRFAGRYLRLYVWNKELTPGEMIQAEKYIRDQYAQPYPWTTQRPVLWIGDSITAGYKASANNYTMPYIASGTLGLGYGQWANLGIGGLTVAGIKANADAEGVAAALGRTVLVNEFEWYNQHFGQGSTGSQVAALQQSYMQQLRAALPAGSKILLGTSTATTNGAAADETERGTYNTSVVNNGVSWGADAILSMHTDTNIGVSGAASNTTYFADGTHLTGTSGTSGYRTLAGLVSTAIGAL